MTRRAPRTRTTMADPAEAYPALLPRPVPIVGLAAYAGDAREAAELRLAASVVTLAEWLAPARRAPS